MLSVPVMVPASCARAGAAEAMQRAVAMARNMRCPPGSAGRFWCALTFLRVLAPRTVTLNLSARHCEERSDAAPRNDEAGASPLLPPLLRDHQIDRARDDQRHAEPAPQAR